MRIFAHDKGSVTLFILCIGFQLLKPGIHRAVNISMSFSGVRALFGPFVLNRAGRITTFGPFIVSKEIVPVTGFIAQRPDDNRGMVLIPFHHPLHPVEMGSSPFRLVPKSDILIVSNSM